jgi:hypothetical protein
LPQLDQHLTHRTVLVCASEDQKDLIALEDGLNPQRQRPASITVAFLAMAGHQLLHLAPLAAVEATEAV